MIINRNNYEPYLVDYAEGILSADLKQQMEVFLEANPDIKEELGLFLEESLVEETAVFQEKDQLKKIPYQKTNVESNYFQTQCVAYVEGLMPENEVDFFIELVNNDEKKKTELDLFKKTILSSDISMFNEKILLKIDEENHKINEDNFEEYCVACVEGWLNQSGLIALNNYIAKKPENKKVLDLYHRTKLSPDLSIIFPNKIKVKKYNFMSLRTKKIFSYVASTAAVMVFGLMVFYSSKLDNPSQLASSAIEVPIENTVDTKSIINSNKEIEVSEKEYDKKSLSDPFGFQKISSINNESQELAELNSRIEIEPIRPIKLKELDCAPCKDIFGANPELNSTIQNSKIEKHEKPIVNNDIKSNAANNNGLIWNITQAGISRLNKVTNSKIKVEKQENSKKTKIEFQSKYFAFSTNVKSRKN